MSYLCFLGKLSFESADNIKACYSLWFINCKKHHLCKNKAIFLVVIIQLYLKKSRNSLLLLLFFIPVYRDKVDVDLPLAALASRFTYTRQTKKDMDPLSILLFLVLFAFSALFSGSEIAFMSLPSHTVQSFIKQ